MATTIVQNKSGIFKVTFERYDPDLVNGIVTIEDLKTKCVKTVPFVDGQIHGDYVAKKNGVIIDKVYVDYNKPMFRSKI